MQGVVDVSDVFTLGMWRVKQGRQDQFIEAWKDVGRHFRSLPDPPGEGTLLQSVDDPEQFCSFGPWASLDDVQAMRGHADTPKVLGRLVELCDEARPGTFRVVATG
jgi:heme-degrading monooxygenase HmoA